MNEKIFITPIIGNIGSASEKGCVVAVGGFDGVHLGHKALLHAVRDEADRLGVPAAVLTFDINDRPKNVPLISTKWDDAQQGDDLSEFIRSGIKLLFSMPYSAVKDVPAEEFAQKYLVDALNAQSIVCGYDFRFGKDRLGSAEMLRHLFAPKGINVITPPAVHADGKPVSSTAIREYIAAGDVRNAAKLLGRRFSVSGIVQHGRQLGGKIGFPTLNQYIPKEYVRPRYGVYAVKVLLDGVFYNGISNYGVKPTVGSDEPVLETHILDYHGDRYGKCVTVVFVDFIRPEQHFPTIDELKKQITMDKTTAEAILKKEKDI